MMHISLLDNDLPALSITTEDGDTLRFEFHPRLTRDEMSSIMVRNGTGKDSVEVPSFQRIARKCIRSIEGVTLTTKDGTVHGPDPIQKPGVISALFNDIRFPQDVVSSVVEHVMDSNQLDVDEGND